MKTLKNSSALTSRNQGHLGVDHLEAHALVIALRYAAGQGGGRGHIAALRNGFVEARGNQLAMQAMAAEPGDGAVGKQGCQAMRMARAAPPALAPVSATPR